MEALAQQILTIRELPEFRQFGRYWEEITEHALSTSARDFRVRYVENQEEINSLQAGGVLSKNKNKLKRRIELIVCVSLALLLSVLFLHLSRGWFSNWTWLPSPSKSQAWRIALNLFLPAAVLAIGIFYWASRRRFKNEQDLLKLRVANLNVAWSSEAQTLAAASVRLSINTLLTPRNLVPFPISAPDLVELPPDKAAASRTIDFVTKFIRDHRTSAIGIAGPRGSGKSTLMAEVGREPGTRVIPISAATKYEPIDLLRRIAFSASSSNKYNDLPFNPTIYREPFLVQLSRWIGIFLGASLTLIGLFILILEKSGTPLSLPSVFTVIAVLAIGVGVIVTIRLLMLNTLGRVRSVNSSPARALADELSRELTESRSGTAGMKLSSLFSFEAKSATEKKRRDLTYGDLIDRLREVLPAEIHIGSQDERVVVILDELDKLPDVESLTAVVNSIKDLFHIPGVHFLVSVSDEALSNFTLRGLKPRDAFDSSFDEIVRMSRLTPVEGVRLLDSRVNGFPKPLALLCNVWAGGIPRDIIRSARTCIEIALQSPDVQPWKDIWTAFLDNDITNRAHAVDQFSSPIFDAAEPTVSSRSELTRASPSSNKLEEEPLAVFRSCCGAALSVVEKDPAADHESTLLRLELLTEAVGGIGDGSAGVLRARFSVDGPDTPDMPSGTICQRVILRWRRRQRDVRSEVTRRA